MVGAESPAVGAVVLLDKDGERIAGNYFEDQFRALAQQQVCCRLPPPACEIVCARSPHPKHCYASGGRSCPRPPGAVPRAVT